MLSAIVETFCFFHFFYSWHHSKTIKIISSLLQIQAKTVTVLIGITGVILSFISVILIIYRSLMLIKKEFLGSNKINVLLYIVYVGVMIILLNQKVNLHFDESCSYILANNSSIVMDIEDGKTYKPAETAFLNSFAAQKGDRFTYNMVWENQANDVHPPLYYCLLHFISSIFIGKFSMWHAAIINIIFALLILFVIRKYCMLLLNNKYAVFLVSLAVVFSPGILYEICFLRMYIMAMFWVAALLFTLTKELSSNVFDWKFYSKYYILTVLSALTHYYCIVFVVALSAIFCILILIQKRFFDFIKYTIISAFAGITAYAIFPAMTYHMFHGYRGTEALDNLHSTFSEYVDRSIIFFNSISDSILGGFLGHILVFFALFGITLLGIKKTKKIQLPCTSTSDDITALKLQLILLAIPCTIYFLIVSKIASYTVARYISPVFPILLSGILSIIMMIFKYYFDKRIRYFIFPLITALVIVSTFKLSDWSILYKDSLPLLHAAQEHHNEDCFFIYDSVVNLQTSYLEVSKYNSVTFININNIDMLYSCNLNDKDKLIISINTGIAEDTIKMISERYSKFSYCEELGIFNSSKTYYPEFPG